MKAIYSPPPGGGAPTGATYIVATAHADLSAEVLTSTLIGRGVTGSRPAGSIAGEIYFDTTTSTLQRYNGSTWQDIEGVSGGGHAILSATHTDVDETDTPSDGQVLTWDSTPGEWVAASLPAAGAHDLISASHTHSGGTDGYLLAATGATTYAFEAQLTPINFIIDGGGVAVTTGIKGEIEIPFGGVITAARIYADTTGSIVVDVNKAAYSGLPTFSSITASAKPTLSSAQKNQDTTLTGWTTTITAGDWLQFEVDSASTVTRATVSLTVRRT